MAYIEISSACNANCFFCPGGPNGQRRGEFMAPALLEKILQKAKSEGFVDCVFSPYNKGEPLLHPQLPEILDVVRGSGLRVAFSSNLIYLPRFTSGMLDAICGFDVSLSGFSNATYQRNHRGGDIQKVLSHIVGLREMRDSAGSSFPITVKWHRYRYNEYEMESAREFFEAEGIAFLSYYAFWGGAKEFESYYEGQYPGEKLAVIRERIFNEVIDDCVARHKEIRHCVLGDILTVDERGRLLVCCAYSNSPESISGDYLSLSRDEILSARGSADFCGKCVRSGWAGFFAAGI